MPFLGFGNYAKPGPGVSKEADERPPVLRFFTVYQRRFSKFMQLNLCFLIPLAAVLVLMVGLFILPVNRFVMQLTLQDVILQLKLWEMYVVPMPLLLIAPFWGGLMVVSRRLANEEYAFIWTEYWKGVKENWKQFFANGIFLYVMYVLLSFSFLYYSGNLSGGFWNYIPYGLIILVAVLLVFSQFYVPLMIVSVNLTLKQIYKNALIFSVMGLWRNILMLLIIGGLSAAMLFASSIMVLVTLIILALLVTCMFSFFAYTNCFIAYPMLQRYIIDPFEKKEEMKNNPETTPSTEDFAYLQDELDVNAAEVDKTRYIYVAGKLVKHNPEEDEDGPVFKD